jgi:hypothetical protein
MSRDDAVSAAFWPNNAAARWSTLHANTAERVASANIERMV